MPRGVRKPAPTTQEQIERVNDEITMTENKLADLKSQRKALEDRLEAEQLDEIRNILKANGITAEELKRRLQGEETK